MYRLTLLIPPALLLIVFATMMWLIGVFFPFLSLNQERQLWVPLLIIMAGIFLIIMSSITFVRLKTTLNPMKPESSSTLIKTGLYRYSRNPIYLGLAVILFGWGVYLSNILTLLFLVGFVLYLNRFQIEPEEKSL
ncbi:MAG: isoprenylcysteine carboxylmethyltransferase family protein, partial [Nitrosomonas sp.]|nr:isoprenylcysteine carboxylmethyltransferase family protein [Nitrosomonas sp.]